MMIMEESASAILVIHQQARRSV